MGGDAISIVSALIEAGNVDTMYRDVYLGRARMLLSPVVSLEAFHGMEQQQSALASLPLATARGVYAVTDVKLDPFCQSLQRFTRVSAKDLPALRTRVVEQLTTLEQSDVEWKDFYAGRRAAFQTRAPVTAEQASDGPARGTSLEDTRAAAA